MSRKDLIRLYHLLMRYRWTFLLGLAVLLGTKLAEAAIVPLVSNAVDRIKNYTGASLETAESLFGSVLSDFLLPIFALSCVMLVTRILSRVFLFGMGRQVEHDLREDLYQKLLQMPPAYFQVRPTGELMYRLTNDITALRYMTGGGSLLGFNTLFTYALYLPLMASMSLKLTAVYFVILPISIWWMANVSGKVKAYFKEVQEKIGDISTMGQENITAMAVIQSYAKEDIESRRFSMLCMEYYGAYRKLISTRIWLYLVMAFGAGVGLLAILLEGGREILNNELTLGEFVAFTIALERISWPTMAMGWVISMFQQGFAALNRIDEVLETEPHIPSPLPDSLNGGNGKGITTVSSQPKDEPLAAPITIEIRHLRFAYDQPYGEADEKPAQTDRALILDDVSFQVNPGEMVALVGPVGCGKSTLLSLLLRLHTVPEGCIFINGQDIVKLPIGTLRRTMAWMPQYNFLFSLSVRDNLIYGEPEAGSEKLETIAETVQIHRDVAGLPQQFDTLVGERGLLLSGGQRQRISLGRSLMVETPLLLLDDPFSNMDADTEKRIIELLTERHQLKNRTTLLASHRFSLVKRADRIVLMDAGKVVAIGTHQELIETQPLYQALNRQEIESLESETKKPVEPWEAATQALDGTLHETEKQGEQLQSGSVEAGRS